MEPAILFDHQIMMLNLNELVAKLEDPPVQEFCDMLRETLKIFQQMGGALAMAFAGISPRPIFHLNRLNLQILLIKSIS